MLTTKFVAILMLILIIAVIVFVIITYIMTEQSGTESYERRSKRKYATSSIEHKMKYNVREIEKVMDILSHTAHYQCRMKNKKQYTFIECDDTKIKLDSSLSHPYLTCNVIAETYTSFLPKNYITNITLHISPCDYSEIKSVTGYGAFKHNYLIDMVNNDLNSNKYRLRTKKGFIG